MNKLRLCFFLLVSLVFASYSNAQLPGASTAKRGVGAYIGSIYWINWDLDDNSAYGDEITDGTIRKVTTPDGIEYTMTITKTNGYTGSIMSYVPGVWRYDDLKTSYNWFKATPGAGSTVQSWPGSTFYPNYNNTTPSYSEGSNAYDNALDGHNSVMAIRNRNQGDNPKFRITVTARNTITNQTVNIAGMVVSGAESLSAGKTSASPYYPREYNQFGTNGNPWQAMERVQNAYKTTSGNYIPATGFVTRGIITNSGSTVRTYNASPRLPNGTFYEGPGDVLWFSKNGNVVDVDLQGEGFQAVAIGFMTSYDYGDAPQIYGNIKHLLDLSFNGGIPNNSYYPDSVQLVNTDLATRAVQPLTIGNLIDVDAQQWFSADFLGDDTHDIDDDDGIPAGVYSILNISSANASLSIQAKNQLSTTAKLYGWIDLNKDSAFSAGEAATIVTVPAGTSSSGIANYTLTFPGIPSTSILPFTDYPARFRIASGNEDLSDQKLVALSGEVEDHLLRMQGVKLSGKIFEDLNKDGLLNNNEASYAGTTPMYAYVLDATGKVLSKTSVVNGAYTLEGFPVGTAAAPYRVMVSSISYNEGQTVSPATGTPPPAYVTSGEDLTKTPAGSTSAGAGAKDLVINLVNMPAAGLTEVNFGIYPQVLSVTFGAITAKLENGLLIVNFTTENEENNAGYEIEISKDGQTFTKVGGLDSKAPNGNSSTALTYAFETSLSQNPLIFGGIVLGAFGLLLLANRRNKKWLLSIAIISIMGIGFSCKKKVDTVDARGKLFVRIVQIDKDGAKGYSKVVQVQQQ